MFWGSLSDLCERYREPGSLSISTSISISISLSISTSISISISIYLYHISVSPLKEEPEMRFFSSTSDCDERFLVGAFQFQAAAKTWDGATRRTLKAK